MNVTRPLILASRSPRRRKILEELGLSFTVCVPSVEELCDPADPEGSARESARRKYAWCRGRSRDERIVAADTVIEFDGKLVTKPGSPAEAREFLRMFSGREHRVLTAVALSGADGAAELSVTTSRVRFRTLDDAAIEGYLRHVDPMDKAGAYDIDQCGERIIAGYEGSWTNIMGLPVEVVREWLARLGVPGGTSGAKA